MRFKPVRRTSEKKINIVKYQTSNVYVTSSISLNGSTGCHLPTPTGVSFESLAAVNCRETHKNAAPPRENVCAPPETAEQAGQTAGGVGRRRVTTFHTKLGAGY